MLIFLLIFLVFSILLFFIISSAFLGFLFTRVPFVPTHKADIPDLVKKLGLTHLDVIYDLGSGNGKVVFLFEKHTGAKVTGFESTLWTHLWAKIKKFFTKSKAEFIYGNFWKSSWTEATVIYMYLFPPLMPFLAEKIFVDCKPGTRIVSRDFENHALRKIDEFQTPSGHTMYVYQV